MQILKERPNVNDYDLKPYGYIVAITNYVDKLEEAINYSQCSKSDSKLLKFMEHLSTYYRIDEVIDCTKHQQVIEQYKS